MVDFSDPCAVGSLYCAAVCNDRTDVSDVESLFAGKSLKSQANTVRTTESAASTTLLNRISDYQVKGWLR